MTDETNPPSGPLRPPLHRRILAESLVPWLAGLLLATPVLVAYYPPMTDLPFHEAAIGLLRHLHDPTMVPPGLYRLNIGEPNQLFHLSGWGLSYLVSTRWAAKLVVAAAVVAIPVCAARFARSVGASPLAALVVTPMALGWLFSWGLIANLLGLAALLWVLPMLDRHAQRPSGTTTLWTLGGIVLLYFAHEAMMLVYMGAAAWLAFILPWSWRKTPLRAAPLVFGVAVTVGQELYQQHLRSPAILGIPVVWDPLVHKIIRIPYIVLPATDEIVQLGMLVLCALTIASFYWLRWRERRESPVAGGRSRGRWAWPMAWDWTGTHIREWAWRYRWETAALGLFAAYFAFPATLKGATLIYQRWFPPAFALFAVVGAPRDLRVRAGRVALLTVLVLPVGTLLASWPAFADSDRAYRSFEQLLPLIEPGSALAELDLGPGDPTRTFSLGPSGGRVLATRGGRLDYAFTDSPASPVILQRRYQWNEALVRIGFDCWAFRPAHDFKSFRYALVRTSDAHVATLAQIALAPEGRYVATAGEWVLFESTVPVIPLTSPPIHLPNPPPEELRDRAAHVVETLQRELGGVVPPEAEPDLAAPNGQHF
jgi:hypothetical protein